MHLRFSGTSADRAPAHQICQILRGDHVEEFAGSRQARIIDIQQQLTRQTQAVVDLEAIIHLRIVDQTLPAHGSTRFFKINAHHHFQLTAQFLTQRQQATGVLFGGFGIVDRARADHHQQAIVAAAKDLMNGIACL
ncbi:hypothetical protein D3C78_1550160 [compost metagenome]